MYIDATFIRAPHLELIAGYLEAAQRREIPRLIIEAPPRHGKSKLTSEMFPAWALGMDQDEQFMLASHTASLPETFSRNVRNLIEAEAYQRLFDETHLSDDSATVQKWTLRDKTRPAMLTVGVGGSPTGQGAKILIIDDPIGSAEEAESELQRDNLYTWYTDTIYPRLEPDAVIIIMMQRWHEDDLTGRLLRDQTKADQWKVVSLPALAETQPERDEYAKRMGLPLGVPDPMGRQPGTALWPERYPARALRAIEAVSKRSFAAKYQQKPRPAEGAKFKRAWLRTIEASEVPQGLTWKRYYDLAHSLKQQASNTATIAGALGQDGVLYLRRGRAGKMESPDERKMIREMMLNEPETEHGIENKVHGGPMVQELVRERDLAHVALKPVNVHADKIVRATPVVDRAEMGKVKFVRESVNDDGWIDEWIDEMCAFPYGAQDDRVDAVSGVNYMIAQVDEKRTKSAQATVVTVDMGGG
jgi:predicted phage terminase large subunit-like protein